MANARPPNILLLWTDQQRNDTLPCHGNAVIQAPTLRRLGEESFIFRRAYCTQPVCTPSRASILTGQWPHRHGCVTNNIPLPETTRTLAELLPETYECAYYGKWHLGSELSAQHGFTDWRSIEDGIYRKYYKRAEDRQRRSDYHHFLLRQGFPPDSVAEDGAELFSRNFAAAMAEPFTKASFLAGEAEAFLRAPARRERPFFLSVNFLEPHPPNFGPLNALHDPQSVPTGPAFARPPVKGSKHACRVWQEIQEKGYKRHPLRTVDDWRRFRASYYGLVTLVDRALARILAALDASGLADNTIVVFTSDHGEMCGDHALVQKGVFLEEACRIPLLLRVPQLARRQVMFDGPISQVDLVPTLLELAGAAIPSEVQGTSRVNVLHDAAAAPQPRPWQDGPVVVEWHDPDHPDEEGRSLITPDGWKLNLYRDDRPELFDLNRDPSELENLASDARQRDRLARLTDELRAWQRRHSDTFPLSN